MELPVHPASNSKYIMKKDNIEPSTSKSVDISKENYANFYKSNFDTVVKSLSENVVVEYLHDILSFLLSDRIELRFVASGYAELFHMNLLRDIDNLHCKYFNKRCASMSNQIIKVLNNKKDVYKCIIFFATEGGTKLAVYKKELVPRTKSSCCEDDSCCNSSNPQSITENLHSECPNHNSHKVSQLFKTRWLNTTLKFIKDESKLSYRYPEMSPMEATFVYSIITRCKEQTDMPANSFYTPLKEAMQIFSLKYFFELTYIDTVPNGKMSLMLEKFPKDIKTIIEGDKRCGNRFRNMKFIKQPKTRTSDESRAGKVVSRLKNQERFKADVNRLGDMARPEVDRLTENSSEPHNDRRSFNPHNTELIGIFTAKRSRKNKLGNGGADAGGFSGARCGAGCGVGCGAGCGAACGARGARQSRATRRDRSTDPRTDKLLKDMSVPIKSDKAMRMMYGMGWDGGALGARGDGITEPIIPALDLQAGAGLGHGVRSRSLRNETSHKTEVKEQPPMDRKARRQQSLAEKKAAKKDARAKHEVTLSTPPVYIPQVVERRHDRTGIFQELLDLITSDDTVKEINRKKRLANKEKGFILHTVRSANERTNMGVTHPEELKLWGAILEEMISNQDLHIKVDISDNYQNITLTKDDSPYMSKKKKRKLQKKPCIVNIPEIPEGKKKLITNDFMRHLTDTYVANYASVGFTTKSPTGLTFRVAILIHLLEIVKNDRPETEIEFERTLNDSERDYLENTMATINVRRKRGGSRLEQEIFLEIRDRLEKHLLRLELLNDRAFIIFRVEKKPTDKTSHDVSYATCSTDENVKSGGKTRCSDDSDAGHEDILGNDDNDGDDERNDSNDSNDISETSKCSEPYQRTEKHEHVIPLICEDAKEQMPHTKTSFDCIIKDDESNQNNIPEKPEPNIFEMHIQDSAKDARELLEIDPLDSESELDFVNLNAPNLETDTSDSKTNFGKNAATDPETDIQKFEENTKIDSETEVNRMERNTEIVDSANDIQESEKNTEMNASKTHRRSSIFDVLQSYVEHFNKNQEINALKSEQKFVELTQESSLLQTDLENLGEVADHNSVLTGVDAESNLRKCEHIDILDNKDDETIKTEISQSAISKEKPEPQSTKVDKYVKRVYLVPDAYPVEEVDTEFARNIQIMISKHIEISTELPLLKCHGVQDGALIYSCHNENTLQWLKNVCATNVIKMILVENEARYKTALKINSFIDYTSAKLFQMLQLYNEGLRIDSWIELSVEKNSDSLTFIVEIDEKSMKCIKESNFTLFAGIDQVQFKPVLD